jgi:acetyl esterase/lipase
VPTRRIIAVLIAATVAVLAVPAGSAAPASASADSSVVKAYAYATTSPAQRLTAHYAPGQSNRPWIVMVHGGYWSYGSRSSQDRWAEGRRAQGYQVFTVDYRLSSVARWPAQRDDVMAAIRWVRAHATTFGIDPRRVVVIGQSAGAHIASVVGLTLTGTQKVAGVADLQGPVDPAGAWRLSHGAGAAEGVDTRLGDYATLLMGCPPRQDQADCWSRWLTSWAARYADPADPHVLIAHSTDDPIVPVQFARSFNARLSANGTPHTYLEVPGSAHDVLTTAAGNQQLARWIDERIGRTSAYARAR